MMAQRRLVLLPKKLRTTLVSTRKHTLTYAVPLPFSSPFPILQRLSYSLPIPSPLSHFFSQDTSLFFKVPISVAQDISSNV